MKITVQEASILHFACGIVLMSESERKKLSALGLATLIELQDKLLKEMKNEKEF